MKGSLIFFFFFFSNEPETRVERASFFVPAFLKVNFFALNSHLGFYHETPNKTQKSHNKADDTRTKKRAKRETDRQREKNDFHRDHCVLVRSPFFFFYP